MNLLQLMQASLNLNIEVYGASYADQDRLYSFESSWPIVDMREIRNSELGKFKFSHIFSANHIGFLNRPRGESRNVLIQAAIHLIESPKLFYPNGTASLINVCRNSIDFYITQHTRMKELLFTILGFLIGFEDRDRILTSRLSVRPIDKSDRDSKRKNIRRELGIDENDIVILNAGGAWKWTSFNIFLSEFSKSVIKPGYERLFFIQPALGQSENRDHLSYHKETEELISSLSAEQRSRIYIGSDWVSAGSRLDDFLFAADYGLNLNDESLEQWQSYRVRTLEYLAADLPIISSRGTFWDTEGFDDSFLFVDDPKEDLRRIFTEIIDDAIDAPKYRNRQKEIKLIQNRLNLNSQAERTIITLLGHPLRNEKPNISKSPLWDYSHSGPAESITPYRILIRFYYQALENRCIHAFLVKIGLRRMVRIFRKLLS